MILLGSLPNVSVLCERRSMVRFFINLQFFLVLCTVQISLSFPAESFVYETNPVQKLSFQYNQDGSTRPIRFKLQAISFKINEQVPRLDVYQDSMQESAKNDEMKNEIRLNKKEELQELEKKFHPLSRFTEFYNTPERDLGRNNEASKDKHQVNSTIKDQTKTEGLDSENNTKDSLIADRENKPNSVNETNLGSEDEITESKPDLSVNMNEIQINTINEEKINSLIGTIKNEYEIVTEGVYAQNVTELYITTEIMLETEDKHQVNSTTEDQTKTESSDSKNNTKDSKIDDREKKPNLVKETNLGSEDKTTESKPDLTVNMNEIQIIKMNKEKIILLGTIKNEYQIVTEGVSVQDVTEPDITTEIMLETEDTPIESYENDYKEANVIKPKENNESDYKSTYEIDNYKNINRLQTTESITIEDLQTDINDNITTEGYTQTDEYEESGNTTESEKPYSK